MRLYKYNNKIYDIETFKYIDIRENVTNEWEINQWNIRCNEWLSHNKEDIENKINVSEIGIGNIRFGYPIDIRSVAVKKICEECFGECPLPIYNNFYTFIFDDSSLKFTMNQEEFDEFIEFMKSGKFCNF